MDHVAEQPVTVMPPRYVRPVAFERMTGITPKAVERKRQSGEWVDGKEFIKGPDGLIYVDLVGYVKWVEKAPGLRSGKKASG